MPHPPAPAPLVAFPRPPQALGGQDVAQRPAAVSALFYQRNHSALLPSFPLYQQGTEPVIDGIIHQDKLGLDVVYIQAKWHAPENTVGRSELQAFVGTLASVSAHKGVFVTTSRFSPGAIVYLRTVNARVITIDGERLVKLMIENGVGVRTRKVCELHRVDEDFFLEE